MMSTATRDNTTWPRPLVPANGPMRADKLAGAAEGMGDFGPECVQFVTDQVIPPDMMTGLTLFILTHQPKTEKQAIPGGGGGVAGGVWVRERFTIHRPLATDEVFTVTGEAVGRHVHKGRRYGTNRSETRNASGELACSNLTTGLLAYKVQEGLADGLEGSDPETIDAPQPDWSQAGENPCAGKLRALEVGQSWQGEPVLVSLTMMEARDTKNPDNPIHSDPELAKKAGLSRPIAGGSHVLSFVLELIFQQVGRQALFYGTTLDIRWKAPVYADATITPKVTVTEATDDHVTFALLAELADATAMTGTVTVPLTPAGS